MFLVQATETGGKLLELNTELIQVLDRMKQLLAADNENADWGDLLLELYRNRDSTSARAAVVDKALAEAGVDEADLNRRLTDLQGYLVEIQDRIEPLLQNLGTPGTLADAKVGYSADDTGLNVGDVAFLVGGSAHAKISVTSFGSASPPKDWGGDLNQGRALQELALAGKVAINGSGRGAWSVANFNASASVSSQGSIRIYHEYVADTARIAALATSSTNFAFPWDLEGLSNQLRAPAETGFRKVRVNGSGSIQLAGGVGVGYAASFEKDVPVPGGTEALSADARVDGSLDVSFSHEGSFSYTIERVSAKDAEPVLQVRLERDSGSARSVALNLDASLQIDGLDRIGDRYARTFFKDPQQLLDKLQKWTRPGDLLADAFAKKDWNNPAMKEVGLLLLGESTAKELSDLAVGKLKTILAREVNQHFPFWDIDSATLAGQLLARVRERLGLGGDLGQKLEQALRDALVKRIDQVRGDLKGQVQKLLDEADNIGTELLDPLEHVGIEVKDLREQANVTATRLLTPVIDYLKRYEQIRLRLLDAIQQTARFKLGMNVSASLTRSRQDNVLLSFRIAEVNANTRAVHRAFVLGRLVHAWTEFRAAVDAGHIQQVEGEFSYLTKRERKFGFALHFGDFGGIERTRVKAEQVQFKVDPSGNILAAATSLSQKAVVSAFHVQRSIGVIGSYDLVAALHDPGQVPSPLAFNIGYEDKKLRAKELRQFLESLEDSRVSTPLLTPGATDAAITRYKQLLEQHGLGDRTAGRVDLALSVSLNDLMQLLKARDRLGDAEIARQAVQVQLPYLQFGGGDSERQFSLLAQVAAVFEGGVSEVDAILALSKLGPSGTVAERMATLLNRAGIPIASSGGGNVLVRQLARAVRSMGLRAEEIVQVVDGVADIAALQKKLVRLDANPLPEDIEPLRRPLDAAIKQINDGLSNWLVPRGFVSGLFDEALSDQTIAFLVLLARISPENRTLTPVVKVDNVEDGLVLVS